MYEQISNFTALLSAYYKARRCKRYNDSILRFGFFLESNVEKLSNELTHGTYTPSPYTYFMVHDPKTRRIAAPAFRDRVVQHSLVAVIEPLFEKKFIYDSYACRVEKGTHFGAQRVKLFLMAARCKKMQAERERERESRRKEEVYVLQCDIAKYFQSISWDILLTLISKTIHDKKIFSLIHKIITVHHTSLSSPDLNTTSISTKSRRGLPIGNLTSQLFANIYLNELDHFIKEELHERWYARYMDDFLIIHPDQQHLRQVCEHIRNFLKEALSLDLHHKKVRISPVKQGVPFVGYRIFYDHRLVRGKTLLHMQKKHRQAIGRYRKGNLSEGDLHQILCSLRGHLNHANAWNLKKSLFKHNTNDAI
ncbi:MAG: reverse transcriptase/maturase family protein [Candidatus Roizmanbacteria bacterium]|nr:reverse transcriptase/maturase family protein [Candidatus Roizmanbacteria bacterium]